MRGQFASVVMVVVAVVDTLDSVVFEILASEGQSNT